jgi:ribonuclease HI
MYELKVYCDGACHVKQRAGGWSAVFLQYVNNKYPLATVRKGHEVDTTNNRMELTAMLESLRGIQLDVYKDYDARIYTDSAYVLNAITKGWLKRWSNNGWKRFDDRGIINVDLWKDIRFEIAKLNRIHRHVLLFKVKGHSGNK